MVILGEVKLAQLFNLSRDWTILLRLQERRLVCMHAGDGHNPLLFGAVVDPAPVLGTLILSLSVALRRLLAVGIQTRVSPRTCLGRIATFDSLAIALTSWQAQKAASKSA